VTTTRWLVIFILIGLAVLLVGLWLADIADWLSAWLGGGP
jgi:hypothetical protein